MYEYIKGSIAELSPTHAVVEAAGVGYFLNISLETFSKLGNLREGRLYTHFLVRDDAQILYGFATKEERELFRLLIGVSGVGGNTARIILSTFAPSDLSNIIATENAPMLKTVKGLGLKTAQKIIVELRDKASAVAVPQPSFAGADAGAAYEEALAALTMLGFARAASDKVVKEVLRQNAGASVEEIVRLSLKQL